MASMLQNKLLELPDSLSDLKSLKSLDVSQNLLTTLNENVFKIGSLEYLVVVGNRHGSGSSLAPLTAPPQTVLAVPRSAPADPAAGPLRQLQPAARPARRAGQLPRPRGGGEI